VEYGDKGRPFAGESMTAPAVSQSASPGGTFRPRATSNICL